MKRGLLHELAAARQNRRQRMGDFSPGGSSFAAMESFQHVRNQYKG